MCLIACIKTKTKKQILMPNFTNFTTKQQLFRWHIARDTASKQKINLTSVKCVQNGTCKRDPPKQTNKQIRKRTKNQSQYLGLVGRSTFLFYVKDKLIITDRERGSVVAE